jgi:hypothetical protein
MARKGRKPKGQFSGKLANFSTRIQVETRKALEREAKASGQSISQLAERLLVDGLAARRDRKQDRPLRALCFLLGQTAHLVVGSQIRVTTLAGVQSEFTPEFSWRSDPFFFEAFRVALSIILEAHKPRGEIKAPKIVEDADLANPKLAAAYDRRWLETFKSPEARGRWAADYILTSLATVPQMSIEERQRQVKFLEALGAPASMVDHWYGMPEAAKDLELDPTKDKTND